MKSVSVFLSFAAFILFSIFFISSQSDFEIGESSVILCDSSKENCGVEYSVEGEFSIFEVKKSGSFIVIDDAPYFSLAEGSFFKLNGNGEISEAFIIASEESSYAFGENFYKLSEGQMLEFKEGRIKIMEKGLTEGESFNFEYFPKGGDSLIVESSNLISIEFDEEGRAIFSGNFLLGDDTIKGLDEGIGKVSISDSGQIIKIWENTKAKIQNIEHISKESLNIYYDSLFDSQEHKNENYFSYSGENIFAGGDGFSFKLLENNPVFPEMEFEKKIFGSDEIKKSDFVVELLGGSLQISEKESKMIIDSEGDFNLKDGMVNILSRDGSILNSISKENNDFAQDLILNKYYVLENSKIEYKGVPVKFNTGPWENTIEIAKNYNYDKRNAIREDLNKKYGVRPRDFHGFVNDGREEQIARKIYEAVESANKNKHDIKITSSELYTFAMLEGLSADYSFLDEKSDINYYNNPNAPVNSLEDVGIDFLGHPGERSRLESDRFIPRDLGFVGSESDITLEYGTPIYPGEFTNLGEALKGVAGVLAQRKYAFTKDFIEVYGEEEFNKLDDDERVFWTAVYYNFGEGSSRAELKGEEYYIQKDDKKIKFQGSGREFFSPLEKERTASDIYNVKNNAMLKVATNELIKDMKYFSFF